MEPQIQRAFSIRSKAEGGKTREFLLSIDNEIQAYAIDHCEEIIPLVKSILDHRYSEDQRNHIVELGLRANNFDPTHLWIHEWFQDVDMENRYQIVELTDRLMDDDNLLTHVARHTYHGSLIFDMSEPMKISPKNSLPAMIHAMQSMIFEMEGRCGSSFDVISEINGRKYRWNHTLAHYCFAEGELSIHSLIEQLLDEQEVEIVQLNRWVDHAQVFDPVTTTYMVRTEVRRSNLLQMM